MVRTRHMIRRTYGSNERGWLFSARFWRDALERAARNAAGLALVALGFGSADPYDELALVTPDRVLLLAQLGPWQLAGVAAAAGAVLSLLTSVVAGNIGERGTAALTTPK